MKRLVLLITLCATALMYFFHQTTEPATVDEQWLDANQVPIDQRCTSAESSYQPSAECPDVQSVRPVDY